MRRKMPEEHKLSTGSVPVPDPTELTTRALLREVAMLKEFIETRINGMDKANELQREQLGNLPRLVDEKIETLRRVHEEKFNSVAKQFLERDTRSERESRDNKVAVDAAFAAQKEAAAKQDESNAKAIDKSEKSTTETIVKLQDLVQAKTDALVGKIDDQKERTGTIEQRMTAYESRGKGAGDAWGMLIGVVGMLAAVAMAIAMFAFKAH